VLTAILTRLHGDGLVPSSDVGDYAYTVVFRARITVILFTKRTCRPLYAIKISPRHDLESAFQHMKEVYRRTPDVVPEPLGLLTLGNHQLLVTRAYVLTSLEHAFSLHRRNKSLVFNTVLKTLLELNQQSVVSDETFDDVFRQQKLLSLVTEFLQAYGEDEMRQFLHQHIDRMQRYSGSHLPAVPQHGDLTAVNIALINQRSDRVLFLDWDDYATISIPVYDTLTFIRSFVSHHYGSMYSPNKRLCFIKEAFSEFCENIGVKYDLAVDLYPICLILYARLRTPRAAATLGVAGVKAMTELRRFFEERERFILG
jgi:hypothetical protein